MKFCPDCQSVMSKSTTIAGIIVYQCKCQNSIQGTNDDTLMAEEYVETAESDLKHDVFIENAPFDPCGQTVLKDCPDCKINFMYMIRIGVRETVLFRCSCGYRATQDEYNSTLSKK